MGDAGTEMGEGHGRWGSGPGGVVGQQGHSEACFLLFLEWAVLGPPRG